MKTHVAIVKCSTYDKEEVRIAVKKAFDLLGGMDSFVKKGEKVLIKPNLLSARPPEDGVCTHLEIIRAVARLVKESGALALVGDNPGGSNRPGQVYEGSGLLAIAKEEDIELKEVKDIKIVNGMPIAAYFFECDKVINLPKMKTHSLMGLTGAVKNMYGAVSGLHKSELHKNFPAPEEFAKVIVSVFEIVKPCLTLMDGIVAMDQDGPAAGRLRKPGLLVAGADSVAVDSVFSGLIGREPLELLTTREAYRRSLGEAMLGNIELIGEGLKENLIKDFELPDKAGIINMLGPFAKKLARFVKFWPYINEKSCRKCNICAESCPVSAISIDAGKSIIDLNKCIRCMCCHEVCPYNAVELRRNILARRFGL